MLRKSGRVKNFTLSGSEDSKFKAVATFASPSGAQSAIRDANGQTLLVAVPTKLFLDALASVKLKILRAMYGAVRDDIDSLAAQVLCDNFVRIRAYSLSEPEQRHLTLLIYVQEAAKVAKAKGALEAILAGTRATCKSQTL